MPLGPGQYCRRARGAIFCTRAQRHDYTGTSGHQQIRDRLPMERVMPVTAVLSKKFYEKFGEDVTNELVNWFNAVDATYRADLRDLNERNFARFDAKLEQRLAESDAKWEGRWHQLDVKLAELKSELLKWMFLFWATTGVALGGLFLRK